MKKLLLAFACVSGMYVQSQTLFSEDFETGTSTQFTLNTTDMGSTVGGDNFWIINNAYAGGTGDIFCPALGGTFPYTIAGTANQPAGITGSPNSYYLHTLSQEGFNDGIFCSSYAAADGFCLFTQHVFAEMNMDVSTVGYTGVEFSFWWACGGATTIYGEVYYSTNGGSTWTLITAAPTQYKSQTTWAQQTIAMAAFDGQPTLRFAFRLYNASGSTSAADPGFSLDDIKITAPGCAPSSSTQNPTICQGTSYFAGGANQTTSGTYYDTLTNYCGMDSVVTTNLTVTPVDLSVTLIGSTLTAGATPATYQWINCSTMAPVSGATNQNFTPSTGGSYAVIVTQSGCTDTSTCTSVSITGINDLQNNLAFGVSPNPFTEQTVIQLSENIHAQQVDVHITDALGKTVRPVMRKEKNRVIVSRNGLPNGLYFVKLVSDTGRSQLLKLVVE
ncbi:MAG TPA: T9SS type A sorting domain-containing protein [Flavobacteriales bacterium]|nr:T9SS type A sorting domain-containing protein [Flavobacteriales bacterium]